MYICICNAITENDIRDVAEAGDTDLWDLQRSLGVASGCGSCKDSASALLGEIRADKAKRAEVAQPRVYQPRAS